MRSILRRAAVLFSSITLIFFWSCERHSPEELGSHGDHGAKGDHGSGHAAPADHGNSGGLANEHGHDHSKPEAHTDGHDHGHAGAAGRPIPPQAIPPVAGSPGQFFPGTSPAAPAMTAAPSPH